ncbi:putative fungal-specific transcription factor [Glonium stellatum]|uniref:Putative fungal-specific transcription factor n=1 Tax=Glonium stellatum TaxID=574774 RepID=A0A8E2EP31_9PEZI|nr:putative fungal-specific transcription factor [Glonium stellatum]
MAICALSSSRARDGALFSGRWDLSLLRNPPSEFFFSAAQDAMPKDLESAGDLNYMRACALLSITSIQYGQSRSMHHFLGLYHTLLEINGLHDESNWPKDAGIVEVEERRRLFWSIYTLDVYTAIVWGGIIRSREAQSNVAYPTALDDEMISDGGYQHLPALSPIMNFQSPSSSSSGNNVLCWLSGWNFTTDLYRILEHALDHFRRRRPQNRPSSSFENIFKDTSPSESSVLDVILQMYQRLPPRFKETPSVVSDTVEHRFNFQTANIAATIQLVRMVLFAAEDVTVEQNCRIASELLHAFSDVPAIYLRAISSPLLHHLAGIGSILGSVFEKPLHESSYQQVRTVLLSMAQLLADLEVGLFCTAGASVRLQTLVARIDEYMQTQRQVMVTNQTSNLGVHQAGGVGNGAQEIAENSLLHHEVTSPMFSFPPELLEDWSWAFDFAQTGS